MPPPIDNETYKEVNKHTGMVILNPDFQGLEDILNRNNHLLSMKQTNLPDYDGKPLAYIFLADQLHEISGLRKQIFERMHGSFADDISNVDLLKSRVKRIRNIFKDISFEESDFIDACLELEKLCESTKYDLISPDSSDKSQHHYVKARYIFPFCCLVQEFEIKLHEIVQMSINFSRN